MAKTVGGASTTEALIGAAAAVLAILGLAGVLPMILAAVSTIGLGAALLIEGGGIAARYEELLDVAGAPDIREIEVGGLTTELVGGVAGVALGILALIGLAPWTLMAIAMIVFGGAHLLGSSAVTTAEKRLVQRRSELGLPHRAVAVSGGARVLIGLAVATLGILVLAGTTPASTLVLISVLALGGVNLLSGASLGARMAKLVS